MVIFIDESGIHKRVGHSTMAVVYVEIRNLENFQNDFFQILKDLKLEEFHWAEQGWKVRRKFFEKAFNLEFLFKVAVFENPVNPNKMMEIVFQNLITEKNIYRIFIDGKKPKWYERGLKKALRTKGIKVKKLRTVRKETSYYGIQLADGLAGLVRYYKDNQDSEDAKRLVAKLKKSGKLFGEYIF